MNIRTVYKAAVLLGFPRNEGLPTADAMAERIAAQMGWKPIPADATKKERKRKSAALLRRYCSAKGLITARGMGGKSENPTAHVYIIQQDGGDRCVKIGASETPEQRIKTLQTGSPYKLAVLALINADNMEHARWMESAMHRRLAKYRINGEWFRQDVVPVIGKMVAVE